MSGDLKEFLRARDPQFWPALGAATERATDLPTLLALASLRRRAVAFGFADARPTRPLRLALVGGYSFHPLREAIEQCLWAAGHEVTLFVGEFDN